MHTIRARVLGPEDGEVAGAPGFRRDRFMVDGADTGSRLSVVEHTLGPRVLVFKPRGQWHTFWTPGDTPTCVLELITPAGLEDLFRELGALGDDFDPATLPAMAEAYGCQVDFEGTAAVIERYGLRF